MALCLVDVALVGLALGPFPSPPVAQALTESRLRDAHSGSLNGIMQELFRGCTSEEPVPSACTLHGQVPLDFPPGAVLRNGPNPRWTGVNAGSNGGWLDGDSMVHCVLLPPSSSDQEPQYSRSWLRTAGFDKEARAGRRLFSGSLVAPYGLPLLANLVCNAFCAQQPQKDTANTVGCNPRGRRICMPCSTPDRL